MIFFKKHHYFNQPCLEMNITSSLDIIAQALPELRSNGRVLEISGYYINYMYKAEFTKSVFVFLHIHYEFLFKKNISQP